MKEIDPDEVFHRINNAGQAWVEANAKARLYEDTEKSELSQITMDKIAAGASSMAQADAMARSDSKYRDFVKEKVRLKQEADEARVTYDAAKIWWEAQRTVAATLRQEGNMINGR
jgi:hypothetical protein